MDIPILLSYKLLNTEYITVEASTGFELNLALRGKVIYNVRYPLDDFIYEGEYNLSRIRDDVALAGDLCVKVWPFESMGLLFGATYAYGLTELDYSGDVRRSRILRVTSGITLNP